MTNREQTWPQDREWPTELTPELAREFLEQKISRLLAQAPQYRYVKQQDIEHNSRS